MVALLQLGANANSKDNLGSTALHIACDMGQPDVADSLLRRGADETAITTDGFTPGSRMPVIDTAAGDDRPRLRRLSELLARALQDKAWRRRGFLAIYRAHPDRVRDWTFVEAMSLQVSKGNVRIAAPRESGR